jgi:hypothetical protein
VVGSSEKGKKFEDAVADIYRLLGAEVIQNIQICNKKVDILATFKVPGSSDVHRVLVECKDEARVRAQNQRVLEFKGLLDNARKSGEANSAEIITRVAWGDAAKGAALQSSISLFTFQQKISRLIDFSDYLRDIVRRFEVEDPTRPGEPPLGKYYVDLSAERPTNGQTAPIPVIDEYIRAWLAANRRRHVAVLGEFGTGKSSFCLKLAYDLAQACLAEPGKARVPILLSLREFTKTLNIEALITSFLDRECGVINPRFRLFKAMNDAGMFVLILDGFDEMATRVDADTLEINLQEVEKLAAAAETRLILTSRTEFFVSAAEERRALRPKAELLATRNQEYEPVKILPWEPEQIELFIERRVPLIPEATEDWTHYRNQILGIPELRDLSHRPVLLDMIVKTLPELISSGKPINRCSLYETYLRGEIKRQKIQKKRVLLLTDDTRFALMRELALRFLSPPSGEFTFADALGLITEHAGPPRHEAEAWTREFLNCSFLVREGDAYRFSHRSIMEYLVARALAEEITARQPAHFRHCPLTPVIAGFLSELGPDTATLWDWVHTTKGSSEADTEYLGGNAVTILSTLDRSALAGQDLQDTVLIGADLSGCDLRPANMRGATLKSVDLVEALYREEDLQELKLLDAVMSVLVVGSQATAGSRRAHRDYTHEWWEGVGKALGRRRAELLGGWISHFSGDDVVYAWLQIRVRGIARIRPVLEAIRRSSGVQAAAAFVDEREELLQRLPPETARRIVSDLEDEARRWRGRRRHESEWT